MFRHFKYRHLSSKVVSNFKTHENFETLTLPIYIPDFYQTWKPITLNAVGVVLSAVQFCFEELQNI